MADERAEGTYDVEAMKQGLPSDTLRSDRPDAVTLNPHLREFLRYGTLRQLIKALIDDTIPDPWWSVAACKVPLSAVVLITASKVFQKESSR